MPTFTYQARTVDGKTVNGVLTAENQQAALRSLDERALFPIRVDEGGQASKALLPGRRRKLGLRVVATFYSQFSDLLRAGVPVLRSLDVLARQKSHPLLSEIVNEVREDVAGGESLADSMAKHPNAFSDLHIAMVRAGERGGFLEDVLSRVAVFTERQDELRNKLIGSLIYPCILLTAGVSVVIFLMSFVVPKIRPILERGGKLPITTSALFTICDVFYDPKSGSIGPGVWLVAGLVVGALMAIPYARTENGRRVFDRLKLRAPLVGRVITMVAICRFCRILGTMLQNGVPLLQSLRVSRESAGNVVLAEEIEKATDSVTKGETVAGPLSASGLFPLDIIDMIAVAEESNTLDTVLIQVANTNEERTARQIDLGVRLVEPLLLLCMAVMVLFIALALLVPILTSSSRGF
jgi:general secretion pathway protein F